MSEMLLVGCKLPHGLVMELPAQVVDKDNFMKPLPPGKRVTLKGAASLYNQKTKKSPKSYDYAITPVPKEFAEEWFRRNKERAYIANGLVFLADKQDRADGIAKERTGVLTGLEPLNGEANAAGVPVDPRFSRREPNPELAEPMGI